jgi:putative ABC transport system permease protein
MNMLGESVSMAISNIMANKRRSFLTMLGIIIGVMAIITLILIMQSATAVITDQFSEMGTGTLTISAPGTALKQGLTAGDLEELRAIPNAAGISPSVSLNVSMQSSGAWEEAVKLEGKDDHYFKQELNKVERGRALNNLDIVNNNRVCIIDGPLMEKVFFAEDPLGKPLRIGGIEYTVVGVLADNSGDVMSQAMGGGNDGKAIVPYTGAMKMSGSQNVRSLELYLKDTNLADQTVAEVERVLDGVFNRKEDSYSIINMKSLMDTMNTVVNLMTMLLVGIASIALLVGGIGIMNMMLVSVTERTVEIGLRKALGAEPAQIQMQFLIESFTLSMFGGAIGALIGIAISMVACSAMGTGFVLSWFAILLGVGFSAAVGILFGWAPARSASNLNPIDALRSV